MPRASAGNPGTAAKIDASGSSSVGDIYMWFHGTGGGTTNQKTPTEGWLRVANLAPGTTETDISQLLNKITHTKSEAVRKKGKKKLQKDRKKRQRPKQ